MNIGLSKKQFLDIFFEFEGVFGLSWFNKSIVMYVNDAINTFVADVDVDTDADVDADVDVHVNLDVDLDVDLNVNFDVDVNVDVDDDVDVDAKHNCSDKGLRQGRQP